MHTLDVSMFILTPARMMWCGCMCLSVVCAVRCAARVRPGALDTHPCAPCLSHDAGLQFRTPDLATQALQLSGINMMGRELRLARPSGYMPPPGGDPAIAQAAGASTAVGSGSVLDANAEAMSGLKGLLGGGGMPADNVKARKLYIGNLPLDMNVSEGTMKDFFNTAMNAAFPNPSTPVRA